MLRPVRQHRRAAAANPGDLDRILHDGNARAREIAAEPLRHVYHALGMTYADHSDDSAPD